jgi:hypothetical protein
VDLWTKHKIQSLNLKVDLTPEGTDPSPIYQKELTKETYQNLVESQSGFINFVYHPELKALLLKNFAEYYQPAYHEKISMLRIQLKQYEMTNNFSKGKKTVFKKRFLKSLETVFDLDGKRILLEFNQEIDFKALDVIRLKFNDEYNLKYTSSEKGILLIYDAKGYAKNPQLTKLQFQVRKIFHDIRYKRVLSTDVAQGFASYFKTFEGNNPKVVVFCGRTEKNTYLSKQIRAFDPFVKLMWVETEDLNKGADDIFDSILPKLGSDYSYETLVNDPDDKTKENLPSNESKELKERINALSREFSIREYVEIENLLIDKMRKYTVANQFSHLYNILDGLRISKDVIFNKLLDGYLD